ncbi:YdeI/OmpD-associated family protein [Cellulomonas cellasea]|uniref:YdeI/OmpD-associated family protein n=1 Tax=Cellulomonas cellasea TaxID=43670 RepID=UPI0025A48F6E|nr:YdeI/OmpD-associated family protein [Cellulomonas cellasea]MDM8086039.1 YdeI/OmpD-associated family protein [Cellulomonas cellasea]
MAEAGRACVAAAHADGSWTRLDGVEELIVPRDLATAFDACPGAWQSWEGFTPSQRRSILAWVADARRAPTRAARVEETARRAADGQPAHQPRRR